MQKPHLGRAASALAIAALSFGIVSVAALSNGLLRTASMIKPIAATAAVAQGSDVDQAIVVPGDGAVATLAVAIRRPVHHVYNRARHHKKTTPVKLAPVVSGTSVSRSVPITFYGAYDNNPSGSRDISNPVLHTLAGGVGSYSDPLTFASPSGTGAYPVGTKIYVPYLQKYFIREDVCATSWTAPNGCGPVSHVDLYMGNPSTSTAVLKCENALTPDGNTTIIVNPASNLAYDPTPLWNATTGACAKKH